MVYRFANCCLDTDRHAFHRDGQPLHIEPQVFELIRVLAEADGALVTHDDLIERVWGGLNISDATIAARVSAARRAVGDSGKSQSIIVTVSRRGFRLAVPVRQDRSSPSATAESRRASGVPTLAVLPFDYRPDNRDDMLAEGVVEEVTAALGRVGSFRVIARQSAFVFRDAEPEIPVVARRLSAEYLLEGSVRRLDDRIRITVDLVSAYGVSLWTARFDDRLDDLFDLQERIAMQVAGQLPVKLRSAEIERVRRPEERRQSTQYDLVLRAMPHFWAHREEANARAVELLSEAIDLDPEYVPALSHLAWALAQKPRYMWSDNPKQDRERSLVYARRAAERVGEDPQSLVAISAAYSMGLADRAPALSFAKRALAIDPNNAWGHMRVGWALIYDGKPSEALASFDRARMLSPLDPFLFNMNIGTALAHSRLGRLDLAIPILKETLASFPGVAWAHRLLATLQARAGDKEGAQKALTNLVAAYPGLTLQHLTDSLPPSIVEFDEEYIDGLRAAGLRDD